MTIFLLDSRRYSWALFGREFDEHSRNFRFSIRVDLQSVYQWLFLSVSLMSILEIFDFLFDLIYTLFLSVNLKQKRRIKQTMGPSKLLYGIINFYFTEFNLFKTKYLTRLLVFFKLMLCSKKIIEMIILFPGNNLLFSFLNWIKDQCSLHFPIFRELFN